MPDVRTERAAISMPLGSDRFLVIEQRHKTKIHMKLLMAVEQSQAGIVGHKIDLGLLVTAEHDNILDDTVGRLPRDPGQFKAMTMQVDWMDIAGCERGRAHLS